MSNQRATHCDDSKIGDLRMERLIGRIIDGEATCKEREHFEQEAAADELLWKTMALRQLDMTVLSDEVAAKTRAAQRVDVLPAPRRRSRLDVPIALSGWAAVLVLAATWAVVATVIPQTTPESAAGLVPADAPAVSPVSAPLTGREHYESYLRSEHVLGELDPILLETEKLDDGRLRLRIVRRIEEYEIIDEPPQVRDE